MTILSPATPKGLRLVHPDPRFRGRRVRVAHPRKDYFLNVDGEGAVIVSETVFQRLLEVRLAGFVLESVTAYPPTQRFNMPFIPLETEVFMPGSEQWLEKKEVARLDVLKRIKQKSLARAARIAKVFAPEGVAPKIEIRRM